MHPSLATVVLFKFVSATTSDDCTVRTTRFCVFCFTPQLAYPIVVVGMVSQVIFSRVRPARGGVRFARTKKDYYYTSTSTTIGRRCGSFFSRVLAGALERNFRHLVRGTMYMKWKNNLHQCIRTFRFPNVHHCQGTSLK